MKKLITTSIILFLTFSYSTTYIKVLKVKGRVRASFNGKSSWISSKSQLKPKTLLKLFKNTSITLIDANNIQKKLKGSSIFIIPLNFNKKKINQEKIFFKKILKLSSQETKKIIAPNQIAGVRGAEQGKTGSFGVSWGNKKNKKNSSDVNFKKAKTLMQNEEFETAITRFKLFINQTKDIIKKAESYYFLAICNTELLNYQNAITQAQKGLELNPPFELKNKLTYASVNASFLNRNYSSVIKEVKNNYNDEKEVYGYWNVQLLTLYSMIELKKKEEAKKLKNKLLIECPKVDIQNALKEIRL